MGVFTIKKRWTDEEIQFLKFAYPNKDFTNKEIFNAFEDKTPEQIRGKASNLKLKRPKEIFPEGYKKCSVCKTILPFKDFSRMRKGVGGRASICKKCFTKKYVCKKNKELKENVDTEMRKVCSKCLKEKPVMDFYRDIQCKDGFKSRCKDCLREYDRKRLVNGGY